MKRSEIQSFPPEVVAKLKSYVYRLIDPRDGETFYVGRGKGNRVFAHIRAEENLEDDGVLDNKFKRIREIHLAGLEVGHVMHRHGLDDTTASEVEAALIDAYPGLANDVAGAGSSDYGTMHSIEVIRRYSAEPAQFRHKCLLISVNRSAAETSLYEATRFAWKINRKKARLAEFVLATKQGIIVEAFVADAWLEATADNFPNRVDSPGRFGFVGHVAPPDIRSLYIDKRVPDEFQKRGAANPIKYTWK